ncbi:hypothetical protein PULV_a0470 [Pseudoalteromonas ulvae UL12]|nr:hypothetical protein [Pseudoalteromonas ulvae UL12]
MSKQLFELKLFIFYCINNTSFSENRKRKNAIFCKHKKTTAGSGFFVNSA